MKRVYLAGPMSGYEDLNIPLFLHVSKQLRAAGYEVFCPGDLSMATFGSFERIRQIPDEEIEEYRRHQLSIELAWICRFAEGMFMLPGWENSSGAIAERALAKALKLDIEEVPEEMLPD